MPLTASDVAFTYNYIIKNNLTNWTAYTQSITKAVAVNDTTVRIECSQPKADMLRVYVPILPEHVWSKVSGKAASLSYANTPAVRRLRAVHVRRVEEEQLREARREPHVLARPRPRSTSCSSTYYTNADTMVQDLKAGTIDGCTGILDAQYRQLKTVPGIEARTIRTNGFDELAFNCYSLGPSRGNPVLKDWKFRQALNWAVDKAKICTLAYGGHAKPGTTVITADYYKDPDWHWQPPADVLYGFDLAKAGQLLDAAGYPLKNGVRVNKQGKPIALRLWSRAESMTSQNVGRLLTGWFRQLGLKITLQTVDDGTLNNAIYARADGKLSPDYDMLLWGWYSDLDPGSILVGLHDCPDQRPERLRLLQPAVRPALRGAGPHHRPDGAQSPHRPDAADPLQGLAVHRHRLLQRPRGFQHGEVDGLHGVAGADRQRALPALRQRGLGELPADRAQGQ